MMTDAKGKQRMIIIIMRMVMCYARYAYTISTNRTGHRIRDVKTSSTVNKRGDFCEKETE